MRMSGHEPPDPASSARSGQARRAPPSAPWLTESGAPQGPHGLDVDGGSLWLTEAEMKSVDHAEETKSASLDAQPPTVNPPTQFLTVPRPIKNRSYGVPTVSAEHKRERNRETFKRFYHRKQQTLRELRAQEEQLEREYRALFSAVSEEPPSSPRASQYVELAGVKNRLFQENTALQHALQEQMKTRRLLGRIMETTLGIDSLDEEAPRRRRTRFEFLRRTGPNDPDRIMQRAITDLRALTQSVCATCAITEAFGWSSQYRCAEGQIDFVFRKRFRGHSVHRIASGTWKFWTSNGRSRTHVPLNESGGGVGPSSHIRSRRRVLETLSDWRCVIYREMTLSRAARAHDGLTKSVFLFSNVPTGDEERYLLVAHTVDDQEHYLVDDDDPDADDDDGHQESDGDAARVPHQTTDRSPDEEWINQLSWWQIEQAPMGTAGQTEVQVTYAGRAPLSFGLPGRLWLIEFLGLLSQWEGEVIGPHIVQLPPAC